MEKKFVLIVFFLLIFLASFSAQSGGTVSGGATAGEPIFNPSNETQPAFFDCKIVGEKTVCFDENGNIVSEIENGKAEAVAASSGITGVCKINSDGTEECLPYENIEIDPNTACVISSTGEQICPTPKSVEIESNDWIDLPIANPKHSLNISQLVADSIDKALESNPTQLFHLVIDVFYGEKVTGEDYSKNINKLKEVIVSEYVGIARKTDEQNNKIFADLPANQIDLFAKIYGIQKIQFDPDFEKPYAEEILRKERKPINENNSITIQISNNGNLIKISKNQENKIVINSNGVEAQTIEKIKLDKNGLKIAEKSVKILPNKAIEKIANQNSTTKQIELKLINEIPKYEITTMQKTNLLWIIPIEIKIKTTINAQTGEIDSIEKPWWSFLAG